MCDTRFVNWHFVPDYHRLCFEIYFYVDCYCCSCFRMKAGVHPQTQHLTFLENREMNTSLEAAQYHRPHRDVQLFCSGLPFRIEL